MRIPMHRGILIAVHLMIVVTMLAIFVGANSFGRANPFLLAYVLLAPSLVIGLSIFGKGRKERIVGYWLAAMMMAPIAVIGIFGGWGLLYLIGIMFLLWAAWVENEGRR